MGIAPPHVVKLVFAADFLAVYPWAFGAQAIPFGVQGPHAPWTFWLTQVWVYGLIAVPAGLFAVFGGRQVRAAYAGSAHWWHLTVQCTGLVLIPVVFAVRLGAGGGEWRHLPIDLMEGIVLGVSVGGLLTAVNYATWRLSGQANQKGARQA